MSYGFNSAQELKLAALLVQMKTLSAWRKLLAKWRLSEPI
jgi:hypothetical protein